MKKLVLGSLALAALATQTTGCIISSEDTATIDAEWSFHTVNPSGQLSPENLCPSPLSTVALRTQELDANDRPIGPEYVDLFDCIDGADFQDGLPPGVFETFIEVTDGANNLYAESIPEIVDLTRDDVLIRPQIIDNGGWFGVSWGLRGADSNRVLSCSEVASLNSIEIIATVTGGQDFMSTKFDCEDGFSISKPVPQGSYTVTLDALNAANEGLTTTPENLPNKTMRDRNDFVDLGMVELQIMDL